MQILKNKGSYLPLFWLIYIENLYMAKRINIKFHRVENAANPLFVERERERESILSKLLRHYPHNKYIFFIGKNKFI